MFLIPKKRFFVGMITLDIASTRFPWPPFKLDWQGSFGTFYSYEKAEEFVKKIKERESAEAGS